MTHFLVDLFEGRRTRKRPYLNNLGGAAPSTPSPHETHMATSGPPTRVARGDAVDRVIDARLSDAASKA